MPWSKSTQVSSDEATRATVVSLLNDTPLHWRLVIARALATEHGVPLGFHDEEDQLHWDRKACRVLREMAEVYDEAVS